MAQLKRPIKNDRCGVYIRATGYGPGRQLQLEGVYAFAQKLGFVLTDVFEEAQDSEQRLAWKDVLAAAKAEAFQKLIVWRLDRLDLVAGSPDKVFNLIADLSASGVRFISVKDHIDSVATGSDLVTAVLLASQRSRGEIKGERIHNTLLASRSHGDPVGRPKKRDDEKILELSSRGFTIRKIADELGISTWSVHAALKKAKAIELD